VRVQVADGLGCADEAVTRVSMTAVGLPEEGKQFTANSLSDPYLTVT